MDKLRSKVDERVVRLSDAISRDLTTPDVKKAQVQKSVKLLLRLGYGEQVIISHRCTFMHLGHKMPLFSYMLFSYPKARRMFLGARSEIIRIRARHVL